MGSSGRLTTATDIPDGLIQNVDVNANAGIAIGKLAMMPINTVMRSNGISNVAGQVLNADLTNQSIRGGVDGAAGKIYPGSLYNSDIAVQQIRGAVDGASSRIAPASLGTADLAANTATNIFYQSFGGSVGMTYPSWSLLSTFQPTFSTPGGRVQLQLNMVLGADTRTGIYIGYNLDASGWVQMGVVPVEAGGLMHFCGFADLGGLGGLHTIYIGWMGQTAGGGGNLSAYSGTKVCALELKK